MRGTRATRTGTRAARGRRACARGGPDSDARPAAAELQPVVAHLLPGIAARPGPARASARALRRPPCARGRRPGPGRSCPGPPRLLPAACGQAGPWGPWPCRPGLMAAAAAAGRPAGDSAQMFRFGRVPRFLGPARCRRASRGPVLPPCLPRAGTDCRARRHTVARPHTANRGPDSPARRKSARRLEPKRPGREPPGAATDSQGCYKSTARVLCDTLVWGSAAAIPRRVRVIHRARVIWCATCRVRPCRPRGARGSPDPGPDDPDLTLRGRPAPVLSVPNKARRCRVGAAAGG